MVDRSHEAGDPACWAHLLEDADEPPSAGDDPTEDDAPLAGDRE